MTFLTSRSGAPPDLHSFPTRRSSDLTSAIPNDAEALALAALAATLTDARRAERFLTLTGLSPDGIRSRLDDRSEEHTSELQSQSNLVCRLLLEKKTYHDHTTVHIARG